MVIHGNTAHIPLSSGTYHRLFRIQEDAVHCIYEDAYAPEFQWKYCSQSASTQEGPRRVFKNYVVREHTSSRPTVEANPQSTKILHRVYPVSPTVSHALEVDVRLPLHMYC